MKSTFSLMLFVFSAGAANLVAQQNQVSPSEPVKTQVNHEEISTEKITLVRDANLPPLEQRTSGNSLQSQYVGKTPEHVTGPDNNPLDINKIRVITPEKFATLAPDAQKLIEADPYYVVTDKSQKEVMADFIKQYSQGQMSRSDKQPVTAPDTQGLPTQEQKETEKATESKP